MARVPAAPEGGGHASHATGSSAAGQRVFDDGWLPPGHSARRDGRLSPEIERSNGSWLSRSLPSAAERVPLEVS